ncbi:MAG: C10 family peptidase [Prevotella sp.]|nr:C10 family peptidase [Prevotella sp.]
MNRTDMVRREFLLACICLLTMSAQAGHLTERQALVRAQQFLSAQGGKTMALKGQTLQRATPRRQAPIKGEGTAYYMFNAGQRGFVIASADDRTRPVLAYSDKGRLMPDDLPAHIQAWLDEYADQLRWLDQLPNAVPEDPGVTDTHTAIAPLLGTILWNQDDPYNQLCPYYKDEESGKEGHCVTGCVATAMAQVMFYHKWPERTSIEIPGFTSSTYKIECPAVAAGTEFDWENMLPRYKGVVSTEQQQRAVAQLMVACGTSLKMDYGLDVSGASTSTVGQRLKRYFDYDASTIHLSRTNYKLEEWNELIYAELAESRPVVYHGSSSGGGHAFVVDGYDKDGFFHVNWGWGGECNGYFLLALLDPDSNSGIGASTTTDGYAIGQGAVVGIRPNTGMTTVALTTTSIKSNSGAEVSRETEDEDFSFTVSAGVKSDMAFTYTFDCGFGLFDLGGNLVEVFPTDIEGTELADGKSPEAAKRKVNMTFGADITEGTWLVKAISREHAADEESANEWLANYGSDRYYIVATISDNTLTLDAQPPTTVKDLAVNLSMDSPTAHYKQKCSVTCEITNQSTDDFLGELYYFFDGERVGGTVYELEAGGQEQFSFTFFPKVKGTTTFEVSLTKNHSAEDFTPLASLEINVEDPLEMKLYVSSFELTNATDGVVYDQEVNVTATLKNEAENDYNDLLRIAYWKRMIKDGKYSSVYIGSKYRNLLIPAGETVDVSMVFDNMDDGEYRFRAYYIDKDSNWTPMKENEGSATVGYRLGDVNRDDDVSPADAIMIIYNFFGVEQDSFNAMAADLNHDGIISPADAIEALDLYFSTNSGARATRPVNDREPE